MLIDTHCHVQFNAYKKDMDEVIKRTLDKGVFMITVGTQQTTSKNGLDVAEKYEGLWATVGLHPNHLCEQEFEDEDELETIKTRCETFDHDYYKELAQHPKCVGIGECGLDYFHLPENLDRDEVIKKQKETFRAHCDLANEVELPLVIHSRDAHEDQIIILQEYIDAGKLKRRGVLHCYTGDLESAKQYIDLGFMISFTGIITFPPRKSDVIDEDGLSSMQQVVRDIPLEYIMVETDAPYLSPAPLRGKRNEPWHVEFVAKKVAEIKKISYEEVVKVTGKNAVRFFGLKI